MSADGILTPNCPMCGQPPVVVVGVQAFCGNTAECDMFCWFMTDTREQILANFTVIDLGMGAGDRGEASKGSG